ncbi:MULTISPECIES: methylated-DNA--[protein]-cysteine S-methyltransferase [unclassified Corynebacterium]|uniref:methylated-DNA--[protein]-cysteine S-methyltransferase n=1 Tax=unclassified Corynebacterium TaxID=2624378 RepID=UPI0034CFA0A4
MTHVYLLDSPLGHLGLAGTDQALTQLALPSDELPADATPGTTPLLEEAARQLRAYFAGSPKPFDVPLDYTSQPPFTAAVLRELARVGYGEKLSYGQLAARAGQPAAVRAVGNACARNPLPLFVPCHRVVRSDGSLGNYRGGLAAKRWLLELEAGRGTQTGPAAV